MGGVLTAEYVARVLLPSGEKNLYFGEALATIRTLVDQERKAERERCEGELAEARELVCVFANMLSGTVANEDQRRALRQKANAWLERTKPGGEHL
jgi:hypothetical protein